MLDQVRNQNVGFLMTRFMHIMCLKVTDGMVTRFDVYETLCPQQMLVHKGGQIKNWSGECRDGIPTKLQCQTIQRPLQSQNVQREIIKKKTTTFFLIFTN